MAGELGATCGPKGVSPRSRQVIARGPQATSSIMFIEIADHVDMDFHLKWKHIGKPPLA